MEDNRPLATWDASEAGGPQDLIEMMAMEGCDRTIFEESGPERDKVIAYLERQGLSTLQANNVEEFFFALMISTAHVAGALGYCLAQVGEAFPTYEDRLVAAMAKAGLEDYELSETLRFEEPTRQ